MVVGLQATENFVTVEVQKIITLGGRGTNSGRNRGLQRFWVVIS